MKLAPVFLCGSMFLLAACSRNSSQPAQPAQPAASNLPSRDLNEVLASGIRQLDAYTYAVENSARLTLRDAAAQFREMHMRTITAEGRNQIEIEQLPAHEGLSLLGLKAGDIIETIDGKDPTGIADIIELHNRLLGVEFSQSPGFLLSIVRDGKGIQLRWVAPTPR